jgi:hypothetical protein
MQSLMCLAVALSAASAVPGTGYNPCADSRLADPSIAWVEPHTGRWTRHHLSATLAPVGTPIEAYAASDIGWLELGCPGTEFELIETLFTEEDGVALRYETTESSAADPIVIFYIERADRFERLTMRSSDRGTETYRMSSLVELLGTLGLYLD